LPVQGQPVKLTWTRFPAPGYGGFNGDGVATPEAIIRTDQGLQGFKLVGNHGAQSWQPVTVPAETPGKFSLALSPALSLAVETTGAPADIVTRVYLDHGGRKTTLATFDALSATQVEVTPDQQFALIVGQQGDTEKAYTVDLTTGETFFTVAPVTGPIHLALLPAHPEATVSAN
jgi:hypothetical protein